MTPFTGIETKAPHEIARSSTILEEPDADGQAWEPSTHLEYGFRAGCEAGKRELSTDAEVGKQLVALLWPYAGDGGHDEGAVDCLKRKLAALAEKDRRIAELEAK